MDLPRFIARVFPDLLLSLVVTAAAFALAHLEILVFGRDWLESLVLAIHLGAIVRSAFPFHAMFGLGVNFAAKQVLEATIVLLGGTISLGAIQAAGPALVGGIACIVVVTIA